jgi:ribosomal protein S18 acetylase RimI-like enzyme
MTRLSWRSADLADAAGLAALFQAVEQSAPVGLETELAEVQARLSSPRLDLAADTLAGVDAAGALLAYAEAAGMGIGQGQVRIRVTSAVHPELGTDVVASTLDWLMTRSRSLLREQGADLPGVLGARCAAADQARLTMLTEAGFEVVRWHQDMVRSLTPPVPAAPPPGVTIVRYDPRYAEAARITHNDAYADDPGALLPDAASWPQHAVGLASFLPAASFLALADTAGGPEVAGFLFSLDGGTGEGLLYCLGTTKPWRQRGLATAMIGHALAAYQQAGLAMARLEVDSTNAGALRLYSQLGFTGSDRGYAMLQAPIS